jgi:hypothetical protein
VTAKVGSGGKISVFNNAGSIHVVADIVGYYRGGQSGSLFNPVIPKRLLDSRNGTGGHSTSWSAGESRDLTVSGGSTSVPSAATAVVLNVTVTQPSAQSHLTVWPAGEARPVASSLNFTGGSTIANLVVVKVGSGGRISIFNNLGEVHVVADVVGYFTEDGGSRFTATAPSRRLDSRNGTGGYTTRWGAGVGRSFAVTGASVPATATAVVMNLTAVTPSTDTYLTAWPAGQARPLASNLNVPAGDIRPNAVIMGVGSGGMVSAFNYAGSIDLVADVVGYYS